MRHPFGEREAGVGRQRRGEIISKKPPNYTRSLSVEDDDDEEDSCSFRAPATAAPFTASTDANLLIFSFSLLSSSENGSFARKKRD